MNPLVRAVAGGALVGGGIAIGAYSGGWFLLLALVIIISGVGLVASTIRHPILATAAGEPVPVTVDLIDRASTMWVVSSTLVAGEARPVGDAPYRFQTRSNLSQAEIEDITKTGWGILPADAVGGPDQKPQLHHVSTGIRASTAVAAVAAMWATIFLPPSGFWDWSPVADKVTASLPSSSTDDDGSRPLNEWYDAALAHLREVAPESLDSLLEISIWDTYVEATVHLGGDRARTYTGRDDEWEASDGTTSKRTRDVFSASDLQNFSAADFLAKASAQLPEDDREEQRMEVSRSDDDIFGHTRPVLAEAWFGKRSYTVQALPDGTVAPWWARGDVEAGLAQAAQALRTRGVPLNQNRLTAFKLGGGDSAGSYSVSFIRGSTEYSAGTSGGKFADPDSSSSSSIREAGFAFTSISPAVLAKVRDDAMRRFEVDPVDSNKVDITIERWGSDGGDREDDYVIEVDYSAAHGDDAVYSLSGQYLGDAD